MVLSWQGVKPFVLLEGFRLYFKLSIAKIVILKNALKGSVLFNSNKQS
jgi:hypothetical protein